MLLQEKCRLRRRRGLTWRAAIRLRVEIRGQRAARVGRERVLLEERRRMESSAKTARRAGLGATAASTATGGGVGAARLPGAPLWPAAAARLRSAALGPERPPHPARSPSPAV